MANFREQNDSPINNVLILTPFRKQVRTLRKVQSTPPYNLIKAKIGTIHSSQGSEASIVIFDPVDVNHPLLNNESSTQLINVALSRAKSKLIIMLSPSDRKHPLFSKIIDIINRHANRPVVPIAEVLACADYMTSGVGKRIWIRDDVGEITEFMRTGKSLFAVRESTRQRECFDIATL